jgi:glycosyltransferase involved in cell wall biosynthesis
LIKTCGLLSRWVPTSIVSCSAYGRGSHGDIGYPKTKMVFIPTGFRSDQEKVASSVPTPAIHPRPRGLITLGMLARISNEKEHILLLEGFRNLLDNGYDLELALAGGVGLKPGESCLEPVIARFGLGARVKLLGNVRNISEFLFSLDIFILLSGSEGFPTVVGEAMAHRRPCVVSDVGDSKVLLSDPLQLTKSDDMDSFIRRVSRIISMTAEERSMIGDRNYDRVARLFTLEKMMERYEAVYRHATKPRVK